MKKIERLRHSTTGALGVMLSCWTYSSPAQTTEDQVTFALEEITITAQRREESANDTAIAISVVSGEELAEAGITDTSSLTDSVPGLEMGATSPYRAIGLRGVNSGGGTQWNDSNMAFSVGGVPLGRLYALNGAYHDLERVEILKGPQGTLYGRNATIGALNLLPNRPTDIFEGSARITTGNYSTLNLTGMINVPLSDSVAARLALASNSHDGYLSNGRDDADNVAARLSVSYTPNDNLSVLLWIDHFKDNSKGPGYIMRYILPDQEFLFPDDPWFAYGPAGCGNVLACPTFADSSAAGGGAPPLAPWNTLSVVPSEGQNDVQQDIYATQIDWDLGAATLTAIPAYVSTKTDIVFYPGGLHQQNKSKIDQQSLEVRLASNDSAIKWLAGAFYYDESADSKQSTLQTNGWQIPYVPNLVAKSYAAFGEVTYPISDRWRLTGGLRYTRDEKSQDGYLLVTGNFQTTNPAGANYCPVTLPGVVYVPPGTGATFDGFPYPYGYCSLPNAGNLTFSDTSWKVGTEFDVSDDWLIYANARTGYKAGGFAPGIDNTYLPEKMTAYEVGSKTGFWNGRSQANIEVFYWDYEDQQINLLHAIQPAGQSSWPVNVPGYVQGVELDLSMLVTAADLISLDVLYAEGKYDVYPTTISTTGTVGGLTDYPRVNLPKWNGTLNYQHTFSFSGGSELAFGTSVHFETETNLRAVPDSAQVPANHKAGFQTWNFDLGYKSSDGKWSTSAYVKNATNEAVINLGSNGNAGSGVFYRPTTNPVNSRALGIGPPRTYGVSLSANF